MRSTFVCVLTLLICNLAVELSKQPPLPVEQALDDDSSLLAPIEVGALTLFPIVANTPADAPVVLTLDEAMRTHELRIREVDGGRVDTLAFANASDHPVFVLAGEVILGGKQDRVVATTTLIPPHTTQPVPVRCIEHGRWQGSSDDFTTAETLAHDRLRGTATYAAQGDVWAEVQKLNNANATTNDTDTYRTLAIRQATDAQADEREIDAALADLPVADRARMIGYAIAYQGEVAAVDKFASRDLFRKLERKLLRSYIAQAIEYPDAIAKAPCIHAVRDFVANAKRGEEERAFVTNLASTLVKRGTVSSTSWLDAGDRHLYANYLGNSRIAQPAPRQASEWTCDRHLYPSYLGNAQSAECRTPDRRLYPSYLGNHPGGQGRQPVPPPGGFAPPNFGAPAGSSERITAQACADWYPDGDPRCDIRNFLGGNPQRLRRTDEEPRLRCERSLYPGYIGNTAAWNDCRRARGLPVAEAKPRR